MVEHLCLDGDGVSVVVGKAGTGKTFALGAAREAWQAAGYPVLGVAVARRAVRELEDGAGIASTSVTALLADLAARGPAALPERLRAGRRRGGDGPHVSAREAPRLRRGDRWQARGGRRSSPAARARRWRRSPRSRQPRPRLAITLIENRRQIHAWQHTALDHLREGRPGRARAYHAHDRERVVLKADYLHDRTAHGDPTLVHGYAITTHVAQGLTVDHAFVLAGEGINRESAYTTLSRGRHSNHLNLARDTDVSRDPFRPRRTAPRRPSRPPDDRAREVALPPHSPSTPATTARPRDALPPRRCRKRVRPRR